MLRSIARRSTLLLVAAWAGSAASIALAQGNAQLNTSLAAEAKQPRTSLFDFLG